jgi:hypothetical protein
MTGFIFKCCCPGYSQGSESERELVQDYVASLMTICVDMKFILTP